MIRARDLGIKLGNGIPGPKNSITDVMGVRVGQSTLIRGEGPLIVGDGPVRTGVTVILPRGGHEWHDPLFAGCHRLNGNGELTGLEWIRESGLLQSPIALTNTHSLGVVRDALIKSEARVRPSQDLFWRLPVVGETWDGLLNDINGQHVRPEHVWQALENATDDVVAEGNTGGGTGMICHGFKGGTGTASRVLPPDLGGYTLGVLVQANHGQRDRLTIAGVPVGQHIPAEVIPLPEPPYRSNQGGGSIIVVIATDAPLLPHQCTRLAQRAGLGIARMGGVGEHWSGDLFLAFSTANQGIPPSEYDGVYPLTTAVRMLTDSYISELFVSAVEATEEAILNALLAAETMTGRDGITAYQLDHQLLLDTLRI